MIQKDEKSGKIRKKWKKFQKMKNKNISFLRLRSPQNNAKNWKSKKMFKKNEKKNEIFCWKNGKRSKRTEKE